MTKAAQIVRVIVAAATLASLAHFVIAALSMPPVHFDDAYMYLRYAKHFLAGGGFSWNLGEGRVYGPTSTLYLFEIVAVRALTNLSDTTVLVGASLTAGLIAVCLLAVLGFVVVRDEAIRRSWIPLAVVPVFLVSPVFRYHSTTGMETMLSLICHSALAIAVVGYTRRPSGPMLLACVLAAYLAYLARPDNIVVALLFPPLFFATVSGEFRRSSAVYAGLFLVTVAADLLLKHWLFGDVVPLSMFAKLNGFYHGYLGGWRWNAADYMLTFVRAALPMIVVIAACARRQDVPILAATFLPVCLTFATYLAMTQIMGFGARYYYPFLAYAALAAFITVDRSSEGWPARRSLSSWFPRVAVALSFLIVGIEPPRDKVAGAWDVLFIEHPVSPAATEHYATSPELPYAPRTAIVGALRNVPDGTVLAASEYGYLGSELSTLTIVDPLGLNDRRVARHGFSINGFFARQPDIIWFPHPDYSSMVSQIADAKEFRDEYEYYPGAFEFGLALNIRSPRFDAIKSAVEQGFARTYDGRRLADYRAWPIGAGDVQ